MTPLLSVLRTEDGTWKRVVEPMLEMEKSVEVAVPAMVEEEMAKSVGNQGVEEPALRVMSA